jgi:hypothetical protein
MKIASLVLMLLAAIRMPAPTRQIAGHAVISRGDPRARIVVPADARYVGTDRWVLFGIADCQIYVFVRADRTKHVRSLYWVQFEGYVPSMPALHHVYTSKRRASLGTMQFIVDTWTEYNAHGIRPPDTAALAAAIRAKGYAVPAGITSGSDEQHVYALLRRAGYEMPDDVMSVRFFHLVDSQKRKELMIIYSEPFSRAAQATLVQRAQQQIRVEPLRYASPDVRH